jgi:hypothetical protein
MRNFMAFLRVLDRSCNATSASPQAPFDMSVQRSLSSMTVPIALAFFDGSTAAEALT